LYVFVESKRLSKTHNQKINHDRRFAPACYFGRCGYNVTKNHRKRKGIIDFDRLMDLLGFENYADYKDAHYKWVDSAMQTDNSDKENKWTQSIAVWSKAFIEKMKEALGEQQVE
jgi:hypothetical protein